MADERTAERWADNLAISPLLARLLWRRGLRSPEAMDVYLNPGLKHLAPLEDLPGLTTAAEVVAEALSAGRTPAIWGDYDVDGVTATALLAHFLRARGFSPLYYLPNRLEHGYGMNVEGVEELAARGAGLLITVDCGIADHAPVARARELGLGVVVTDHHLPGESLPEAHAVCDPRLGACAGADLAGVGVAFLLAAALNRMLPGAPVDIRDYLDLVALGTIADVVPLTGQNRILTKNGLLLIAEGRRPGIAALKEAAGYAPTAELGAGQVAFGLAPRINAAGRLGAAQTALDLLLASDVTAARPLAAELDAMNAERRRTEEEILEQAQAQAGTEAAQGRHGLVLFAPHWHQGVIGIVASRVVEAHYRPTLIVCEEDGVLKGSGRSIPEVDLHAALAGCADLFLRFGGHRQAAGFSMKPAGLDALRERFSTAVAAQTGGETLSACLKVDAELPFADVDFTLLKEIESMQPFGMGNPEPVFASPEVRVASRRVFGKNHVSLDLREDASNRTLRAKAWRMAEELGPRVAGASLRFAFTPRIDRYNGAATIELNVRDWNAPGTAIEAACTPGAPGAASTTDTTGATGGATQKKLP